jgi:hypothetical protein
MRSTLIASLALLPAVTNAGPLMIGAGFGASESDSASASSRPNSRETLGLFGRLALSPHWAAQVELQRTDVDAQTDIRAGSALLVLDGGSGSLVPVVLAGVGLDHSTAGGATTEAHHVEVGIGLELRTQSGLVLGADARMGDMTIDTYPYMLDFCPRLNCDLGPLHGGEYHSARATVGVRF